MYCKEHPEYKIEHICINIDCLKEKCLVCSKCMKLDNQYQIHQNHMSDLLGIVSQNEIYATFQERESYQELFGIFQEEKFNFKQKIEEQFQKIEEQFMQQLLIAKKEVMIKFSQIIKIEQNQDKQYQDFQQKIMDPLIDLQNILQQLNNQNSENCEQLKENIKDLFQTQEYQYNIKEINNYNNLYEFLKSEKQVFYDFLQKFTENQQRLFTIQNEIIEETKSKQFNIVNQQIYQGIQNFSQVKQSNLLFQDINISNFGEEILIEFLQNETDIRVCSNELEYQGLYIFKFIRPDIEYIMSEVIFQQYNEYRVNSFQEFTTKNENKDNILQIFTGQQQQFEKIKQIKNNNEILVLINPSANLFKLFVKGQNIIIDNQDQLKDFDKSKKYYLHLFEYYQTSYVIKNDINQEDLKIIEQYQLL